MGSFSMNCSISGLGISGGTKVRCLLLTQSPYDGDDPRKAWIIRTPPVRAQYNDYGSIEQVHPDDQRTADLWLRGLYEDTVEKGLGDNSCHDVAVARDMSFEEMLNAIQERRLEVIQDAKSFWSRSKRDAHDDEGVDWTPPLMKRVEAALEAMQPGCTSRNAGEGKYVVDEPVPYMARVRFGRYEEGDHRAKLEEARVALDAAGHACVITTGTGRYANAVDLLVFPKPREPGSEHVHGPMWDMRTGATASDTKTLRIGLAMIREDVWQALASFPHRMYVSSTSPKALEFPHVLKRHEYGAYAWYDLFAFKLGVRKTWEGLRRALLREPVPEGEKDFTPEGEKDFTPEQQKHMDDVLGKIREAYEKKRAAMTDEERAADDAARSTHLARYEAEEQRKKDHPFFGDFRITSMHHDVVHDLPGGWTFVDSVPGVIGIGDHFSMLVCDKTEAWDSLLDGVAELAAVRRVIGGVGAVIRPAESTGPQCVEWDETMRYQKALLDIATLAGKDRDFTEPAPTTLVSLTLDKPAKLVKPRTPAKPVKKKPTKKPVAKKSAKKAKAKKR